MTDLSNNELSFEDLSHQNGMTYWWASDLKRILNYKTDKSFNDVIERTQKGFMSLKIPIHDNMVPVMNDASGKQDYKLSRFACYLLAMNASSSKPEVAKAQAYFATMTRQFELMLENSDQIDRLVVRDELKEGTKALNAAAKQGNVSNYAKFANAGYLGLYNMQNWKLAEKRNINRKDLLEHMGRTELAANLFRITMTEERIKNKNISGQHNLEDAHHSVGAEVREMVIKNTGVKPEDLPVEKRLPEVKKETKKIYKQIKDHDKK